MVKHGPVRTKFLEILLTKEFLLEQYASLKKSQCEIAKEFNISRCPINKKLRQFNIPIRGKKEAGIVCSSLKKDFYKEMSKTLWSRLISNASSRGFDFSISKEYVWNLFIEQNRKCALTGWDINFLEYIAKNRHRIWTASLDRIDSSKGYIEGNVQWLHKWVNVSKMDMTDKEFFEMCRDVHLNCKDKYE